MSNFNEMSSKELVNAYNAMAKELDENLVVRFSSRANGIARCEKLKVRYDEFEAEQIGHAGEKAFSADFEMQAYGRTECPHCGVHLSNGVGEHEQDVNGKKIKHDKFIFECLGCGEEFGPEIHKVDADRSAAIANSWLNPETAEKRKIRHSVRVDGVEFRSVRQAFVELKLPLKEHIKFRMELKAEGQLNAYGKNWEAFQIS